MTITATDRHDLITPAKLRAWGACWTDENIARYFGDREAITAREISGDETIRHRDRMWVLTHALACKDIWLIYDFALWCAEQALKKPTPEWQTKLWPVFVQVRGLRDQPVAAATAAYAAATGAARAADAALASAAYVAAHAADRAAYVALAAYAANAADRAADAALAAYAAAYASAADWAAWGAALGHALAMLES